MEKIEKDGITFYKLEGEENIEDLIINLESGKTFSLVEIIGDEGKGISKSVESVIVAEVSLSNQKPFNLLQQELVEKWSEFKCRNLKR